MILGGCTSSGVISTESGGYTILKKGLHTGIGAPDAVKSSAYNEASKFCAKENKKVETLRLDITKSEFIGPVKLSLTFQCV